MEQQIINNPQFTSRIDSMISKEKNQKALAKKTGISEYALYRLKNNKNNHTIEQLIKLADYWGVTLDFLCGRAITIYDFSGYTTEQLDAAKKIGILNSINLHRVNALLDGLIMGQ